MDRSFNGGRRGKWSERHWHECNRQESRWQQYRQRETGRDGEAMNYRQSLKKK